MSVAYDPKSFINEGAYPSLGDEVDHVDQRFTDHDVAEQLRRYTNEASMLAEERTGLEDERDLLGNDAPEMQQIAISASEFPSPVTTVAHVDLERQLQSAISESASPADASPSLPGDDAGAPLGKVKMAKSKPIRDVFKQADGKYHCPIDDCKEDVKTFGRKCEYNKHMDKHERPYVCTAQGCEGLPGFTYSGGLLRHEREVHGKHGGPRNTVNCPHKSCKRHTGKGFSRLENLNEHLRRVHTNATTGALAVVDEMPTMTIHSLKPGKSADIVNSVTGKRKRSLFDILDDEDEERSMRHQARQSELETNHDEIENPSDVPGDTKDMPFRELYRLHHQEMMSALREVRDLHDLLKTGLREAGLYNLADEVDRVSARHPLTVSRQLAGEAFVSPSPTPENTTA